MIFCCHIPVLRHFVSVLTGVARQNLRSPQSLDAPTFLKLTRPIPRFSTFYSSLLFSHRLLAAMLSFSKSFSVWVLFSCIFPQLFTTSIYSRDNPFLFKLFNTLLVVPNRQWFFPFNRAPVAEDTNLKSYLPRFSIQPLLLCFIKAYILNSFSHFHRFPCFLNKETSQLEFCASRRLPLSPLSTLQVSFLCSGQSSQTFQHEVNFTGTCAFHVSEATDKFENWVASAFLPPPEFCVGNWGIGSAPRRKIECIGKSISNYRIAKVTPTLIASTKKPTLSLGSIVCWSPGQLPQEDGFSPFSLVTGPHHSRWQPLKSSWNPSWKFLPEESHVLDSPEESVECQVLRRRDLFFCCHLRPGDACCLGAARGGGE